MKSPEAPLQDGLYEVYEQYYETYKYLVYNRTRRRLSGYRNGPIKQEVEDLAQEVFQDVFRWMKNYFEEHKQFPSEEIFERVLKTIEINEYRSYLKRLKCLAVKGASNGNSDVYRDDNTFESCIRSEALNPEEELLWREYQGRLETCLKKLNSRERAALLCKARGDSDREIAALIGEDEKKVTHSIILLARKKLRKWMEAYKAYKA